MSQPVVVLLPCVPATPTSVRPTAASATTCCQGSSGIPAARAACSSGWSGSIAVSAFVTASRSGCGRWVTCSGSWCGAIVHAERLERGRVRRRRGRVAARDDGPRPRAEQRRGARPGPRRADDVDPLEGPDGSGGTRRREAGPDPVRGRGHADASTRSSRSDRAAPALWRLLALRSPLQTWRFTATPTASATAT